MNRPALFHVLRIQWAGSRAFLMICLMIAMVALQPVAEAQSEGLQGYWRGSGYVSAAKGQRERVRCRVWISRGLGQTFGVKARCASPATNIDQTGRVSRTGSNSYVGDFYNSDFNIRGRIRIILQGNRQSVTMHSDAGSGRLTLYRR